MIQHLFLIVFPLSLLDFFLLYWMIPYLQVSVIGQLHGESSSFVAKIISIKAKLVGMGRFPVSEMSELKAHVLNARTEGQFCN